MTEFFNLVDRLLALQFHENRLVRYLLAVLIVGSAVLLYFILKKIIRRVLRHWTSRAILGDDVVARALEKQVMPLIFLAAAYFFTKRIVMPPFLDRAVFFLWLGLFVFFMTRLLVITVLFIFENYWIKKEPDPAKRNTFTALKVVIQFILWTIGILIFLDNAGVRITGLIAGLGLGGVAVAFAAQSVLGDIFNYFTIFMDRPFDIGDFLVLDKDMGFVEEIGLKNTRIRSLGGEQLILPNTVLTSSRVKNYKRMENRRVEFRIGVTYETPMATLREIPVLISDIIRTTEGVRLDRVHFESYGDFSLVFDVVYFVLSADYTRYMDLNQTILFKIKEAFEKRKIDFAYPTQTLIITKDPRSLS